MCIIFIIITGVGIYLRASVILLTKAKENYFACEKCKPHRLTKPCNQDDFLVFHFLLQSHPIWALSIIRKFHTNFDSKTSNNYCKLLWPVHIGVHENRLHQESVQSISTRICACYCCIGCLCWMTYSVNLCSFSMKQWFSKIYRKF